MSDLEDSDEQDKASSDEDSTESTCEILLRNYKKVQLQKASKGPGSLLQLLKSENVNLSKEIEKVEEMRAGREKIVRKEFVILNNLLQKLIKNGKYPSLVTTNKDRYD
jgi:hypothetical protein